MTKLLPAFSMLLLFTLACTTSAQTGEQSVASQNAGLADPSGCGGADLLRKLDAEFAANPHRAKANYQEEKMCVEGTVSDFLTMYGGPDRDGSGRQVRYPAIHVDVSPGVGFLVSKYSFPDSPEAWDSWMMAVSIGDKVRANCYYALDRSEPWMYPYPESGTIPVAFTGCEVRE